MCFWFGLLEVSESFSIPISEAWRLEHSASNGIYSHENVRNVAELASDHMVKMRNAFVDTLLDRFVDLLKQEPSFKNLGIPAAAPINKIKLARTTK